MPRSGKPERWVIATGNTGKLAEITRLLAPYAVDAVAQSELGIVGPPETGLSFLENALLKARHAARASGLPALADDSGLCVAALEGAPGLHSARFAGPDASDSLNMELLLERLRGVPAQARTAHFVCVIVALRSPSDPDPLVATGRWYGSIAAQPRGAKGFGYDPIFEIPGLRKTAAQLEPDDKSRLSHRGQALRQLFAQWAHEAPGA
jgi:XTP/dITP diphosphohydrolase